MALILFNTLLGLPQPLLNCFLIDELILPRQLSLMPLVLGLIIGIKVAGILTSTLQQYYFIRFDQDVLLDIQADLFHQVSRFPNSFFDEEETGYLMSRLSSDVSGLRWFFSSTPVYIVTIILRFIGGIGLLLYLEWRLATAALVVLPGLVAAIRYFSGKFRVISHRGMEQ